MWKIVAAIQLISFLSSLATQRAFIVSSQFRELCQRELKSDDKLNVLGRPINHEKITFKVFCTLFEQESIEIHLPKTLYDERWSTRFEFSIVNDEISELNTKWSGEKRERKSWNWNSGRWSRSSEFFSLAAQLTNSPRPSQFDYNFFHDDTALVLRFLISRHFSRRISMSIYVYPLSLVIKRVSTAKTERIKKKKWSTILHGGQIIRWTVWIIKKNVVDYDTSPVQAAVNWVWRI